MVWCGRCNTASVFNRGTRDRPNWNAKIKDRDGKWKMVPTKQRTKAKAVRWAAEKDAEIADGEVGLRPANEKRSAKRPTTGWRRTVRRPRLARRQRGPHETPAGQQLSIVLREWRKRCPSELLVFPKADGTRRARERPPIDFADHLTGGRCHAIRGALLSSGRPRGRRQRGSRQHET
jgi:hypothetical protein